MARIKRPTRWSHEPTHLSRRLIALVEMRREHGLSNLLEPFLGCFANECDRRQPFEEAAPLRVQVLLGVFADAVNQACDLDGRSGLAEDDCERV